MKANALSLLALFQEKQRLEVPIYQRKYVWSEEEQWDPLWQDISRKFRERLEGRNDSTDHFLGAMVLDQQITPSGHVVRRQVIDGQQRLTTLQIFLSALRDFCRANGCEDLAKEFDDYTLNRGLMADPATDKFKVWPTIENREQFTDVVGLGSRAKIETKHPEVWKKYARAPDPRPRMVEAYLFFSNALADFFLGSAEEPALLGDQPLSVRIDECFQALKSSLRVVVIDLERGDEAQVIFETLNARGEPLLSSDLLRNYIFLRAGRAGEPQEQLHADYWRGFEDPFWSIEVRQGRLTRPRSDLFMQHFLASRRAIDIPAKQLFAEYRQWIDRQRPFATVAEELCVLARQREEYRRLVEPKKGDPVYQIARFLEVFEVSPAYPLLLHFFDVGFGPKEWQQVSTTLESYLLRRTILRLSNKAYNAKFLALTKWLKENGSTPRAVSDYLTGLQGPSVEWPTDAQFAEGWRNSLAYDDLNNARLVHILLRVSDSIQNKLSEKITIESALTVEHILPRSWIDQWALPSGERGLTDEELQTAATNDPRAEATRARHALLHTFGNLTVITQGLNSSVSNSAWATKKPGLLAASLLPINQSLHSYADWNEDCIRARGEELLKRALTIWPGPTAT
jgi:hypothetical protein